jgi:hypothetical protein
MKNWLVVHGLLYRLTCQQGVFLCLVRLSALAPDKQAVLKKEHACAGAYCRSPLNRQ